MDEMIHAALRPEELTDDELSAALQEEALTIERTKVRYMALRAELIRRRP